MGFRTTVPANNTNGQPALIIPPFRAGLAQELARLPDNFMSAQPNFLIIMSDQHAPDAIGGLGHPAVISPALDQLIARGVSFRNAYCSYPMCTPSRAGFMTGHHSTGHGVWELGDPLPTSMPTWAHVLRRAGYTTSIAGRMHFVGPDLMHGFERRVYPELGSHALFAYGNWDQPQTDQHVMVDGVRRAGPQAEVTRAEAYDTAVTDAALAELAHLTSAAPQKPWALHVGLYLPHIPYAIRQHYYDRYDGVEIPLPRQPPDGQSFEAMIPPQMQDSRKWLGLTSDGATPEQVTAARRAYFGMITCMDELIGKLVRKLDELGVADNTWIIYLSDHGENLGEHGFWSKLNFYEDSVRVPLIIVPPRCADPGNPGAECHAPVSLLDWMSTVLDLTGEQANFEPMPGRSLLPLLADPTETWPQRAVLSDYACDGTRVPLRMVRQGPWKACFAPGFTPVLFNLEEDPHEWHDRGSDPACSPVLAQLLQAAHADGWDGEQLRAHIHRHKRRLDYIGAAERTE